MFHEGQQIGSYTLLRKLGKGGFGEVWLAEKRSQFVTKKVAVKLPLDEQVNLDAIRQEAELWEQASGHANVLPIIDADIIDGQVVIVSEYADGGSLADRLKRDGSLPLQKAVEMTIGILNGLEFLHNRKIIHRDIKPQNILLQGDTPRLADFGISRAMNTTIVSSAIIGTDAYMSPESFDGKRNVQTDIWSVGVVLYALLTDRLPFPQEHPSERMFAILTKEFEPLPPEVPQNLQQIVYRALAKQPENRYQTTAEMRDELQRVLVGMAHRTFAATKVLPKINPPYVKTEQPTLSTIQTVDNLNSLNTEQSIATVVVPQPVNTKNKSRNRHKTLYYVLAAILGLFLIFTTGAIFIYPTWKDFSSTNSSTPETNSTILIETANNNSTDSDAVNGKSISPISNLSNGTTRTPKNIVKDDSKLKSTPTPNTKPQKEEKIKQITPKSSGMCRSIYFGRSIPTGANVTSIGCVHCESSLAIPNTRCP